MQSLAISMVWMCSIGFQNIKTISRWTTSFHLCSSCLSYTRHKTQMRSFSNWALTSIKANCRLMLSNVISFVWHGRRYLRLRLILTTRKSRRCGSTQLQEVTRNSRHQWSPQRPSSIATSILSKRNRFCWINQLWQLWRKWRKKIAKWTVWCKVVLLIRVIWRGLWKADKKRLYRLSTPKSSQKLALSK